MDKSRLRSMVRTARRTRRGLVQSIAAAIVLVAVVGTYSAWTGGSTSPDNVVEAVSEYQPPTPGSPPVISGTQRDGETLTATTGSWSGAGASFDYQWQWLRCDSAGQNCAEISGATGQQYVLTHADVIPGGLRIRVRVTATSLYGEGSSESAATGLISAMKPIALTPPTVTGVPHENQMLTGANGTWEGSGPLNFSYLWYSCDAAGDNCVLINESDGRSPTVPAWTHIVSNNELGRTIRMNVVALYSPGLPGGQLTSAPSAQTAAVTQIDPAAEIGYTTDGTVNALHRLDGNTYLGGDFSMLGKPVGSFSRVSLASGQADFSLPTVTGGYVNTIEPDGAGGWYIGGSFTHVDGVPRANIAHVLADSTVDPAFNPGADNRVLHIELVGPTLYIGGRFTTIGGQSRNRLAAMTAANGTVLSWNPGTDGDVYVLVMNGSTVFVGGAYTTIAGTARRGLAEVSLSTGTVTAFNPSPLGTVVGMIKSGTTLYFGGTFPAIFGGGLPRGNAAAVNITTGSPLPWNPNANAQVRELTLNGSTMFLGGEFTTVGGASHPGLVGVDLANGAVNWNPPDLGGNYGTFGTSAWEIHPVGSTLYVGGEFRTVAGQARRGLAAFDIPSATLTSWAPQTNGIVQYMLVDGGDVLVGGYPNGVNSFMLNTVERNNIAALDASGVPTSWNPDANDAVRTIISRAGKIYYGGDFTTVGGQARQRLAASDAATGALETWNPGANAAVRTLGTFGANIYSGGDFTTAGGAARSRLAAFSTTSNAALTFWTPTANSFVTSMHVTDLGQIYIGGDFTTINGTARNRAARLSSTGNTLTTWDPNANGLVRTITAPSLGSPMYLGGDFTTIGGQTRNRIAAVETGTTTGPPTTWNPGADGPVHAIFRYGRTVWVGGQFNVIGGQARPNLAGLRANDGTPNSWVPPIPVGPVQALLSGDSGLHAGGGYTFTGDFLAQGYAHFP